jgi:hypothetical protein
MPEITPQFQFQYESRMRAITETEYARRLAAKFTWWNKVLRPLPIEGRTERVTWLLDTATIEPIGPTGSGRLGFEELVTQTAEYPTFRHGRGIRVHRDQLEDLDGTGLDILGKWSALIGNEIAYVPQRLGTQLILNGANTDGSANAYDGQPFFADNATNGGIGHPYNPYATALGGYANWLHGAAAGQYPGACPIDETNAATTDIAFNNLQKVITFIASIKMPNGVDPRMLTPVGFLIPPSLTKRAFQITDAKFIAQAAGASGGGAADIEAVHLAFGLGQPLIAQELGANFTYSFKMPFVTTPTSGIATFLPETVTGSNTTYYVICQEMATTQLGGLLYVTRKPFKVNYYTGDSGGTAMSEFLDRTEEFEYHVKGRVSAQYGHPYTIFRVDGT